MIKAQELSERLRQSTETLHREAERSGYIAEILRKRASVEGYGLYLRNLEPAYDALENGLRTRASDGVISPFNWQPLFRHQAMLDDLSTLATTPWQDAFESLPESRTYAARIEQAGVEAPHRLLGHAYVRYIGDLSGGQIVKAILSAAPGLRADMLTFYDFQDIPDADMFKSRFRDQLDRAGDVVSISDDVVDEALAAFQLNIDLSRAVHQAMQRPDR